MRSHATVTFSLIMIGLGLVVIVRTLAAGVGGGVGLVLGGLLVAAGALRLYLMTLSRSRSDKARPTRKSDSS